MGPIMASLKEVAEQANVSQLTAYQVLNNTAQVDTPIRDAVIKAARALKYRLNITIRDVADQAGVSIATVSYVLNDSVPVSPTTKARVLQAAAQLNYRPNITARNLKASETRMIGYAWHDVQHGQMNPVLDRFLYCMAYTAESYSYHVLTFTQPHKGEVKTYEDLVQTSRVDGFIMSSTTRSDKRIRRLLDMGVPFASFGRSNPEWDFPYVDVDGRAGVQLCMEHLFERGHQRIAFLGWPEGSLAGDERLGGYLDALELAGIKSSRDWIIRCENNIADSRDAAQKLMEQPDKNRPTAIVCVSDLMAIGAMNYLESVGLQVGEDCAVTGFDDHPMSEFLHPSLTTLRQPIELLAEKVMDLLIAEINRARLPQHQIMLPPQLMIRGSSTQNFNG
jgi:DNA-binding LacI/PurR family transcriptional regulator